MVNSKLYYISMNLQPHLCNSLKRAPTWSRYCRAEYGGRGRGCIIRSQPRKAVASCQHCTSAIYTIQNPPRLHGNHTDIQHSFSAMQNLRSKRTSTLHNPPTALLAAPACLTTPLALTSITRSGTRAKPSTSVEPVNGARR